MRVLGIDYGEKKIGLALGDTDTRLAVPLEVWRNEGSVTFDRLAKYILDEQIGLIVVGVPLAMGHHGSEQLGRTRKFIADVSSRVSVPVVEEDESHTTAESIRLKKEEGATADEDALAAMLIAQQYLSTMGRRVVGEE